MSTHKNDMLAAGLWETRECKKTIAIESRIGPTLLAYIPKDLDDYNFTPEYLAQRVVDALNATAHFSDDALRVLADKSCAITIRKLDARQAEEDQAEWDAMQEQDIEGTQDDDESEVD